MWWLFWRNLHIYFFLMESIWRIVIYSHQPWNPSKMCFYQYLVSWDWKCSAISYSWQRFDQMDLCCVLQRSIPLHIKISVTFNCQHLKLPGTNTKYPLCSKLKLVPLVLSNNTSEHKTYLNQQRKLFCSHGDQQLKTDTTQYTRNDRNFVVRETLIAFNQLWMMLSLSFYCYTIRGKVIGPFVMSEYLWII